MATAAGEEPPDPAADGALIDVTDAGDDEGVGAPAHAAGSPSGADDGKAKGGGEGEGAAAVSDAWRERLFVGQKLDVLDETDSWCEAEVVELQGDLALIHFLYWSSKWDVKLHRRSPRLAPYRSRVYWEGGPLRLGQWLDVFDTHPKQRTWVQARIVDEREDAVKVHFKGWKPKWDEWLPRDDPRIKPWCSHTAVLKPYRPKARTYWRHHARARYVQNTDSRMHAYRRGLQRLGFALKPVDGDGNCLFRSVSHQVYGSDAHHAVVRAAAVRYMQAERDWFRPFVASDDAEFDEYLERMARNGEWGDDPEIQAMCEIYNRPAAIFAYDAAVGARCLRTFHEAGVAGARAPMRLSYYGGGHYDAIVSDADAAAYLTTRPGEHEERVLASLLARPPVARGVSEGKADDAAGMTDLQAALQASREQLDDFDQSLEAALQASLGTAPADMVADAMDGGGGAGGGG
eukprot:CAMPEP_0203812372 /NCGR_PEP_ID=MMETSP0115-20131106/4112_1 /ASSEMBLY_ACC=CAM_ASM_000227 /TAXON_ID=33651 /ORGANISM="Bicosoecid sp, Strain ms1" /LENGTH=459 /DNA_ID=CAMNT_0050721217 /DNA_START=154 /DNA_END=1529 /DNA_ORIENTATION=-